MAGTGLDPQSFFTQMFMPQQQGASPFSSGSRMSPGVRAVGAPSPGQQQPGMMIGQGGQPQTQPMGGAAPQNYLDQSRGFGGPRADPYAPTPPPSTGGGLLGNVFRGLSGQPNMRDWQNQESYKSAMREWQAADQEWQLKKKAYDEGQAEQRETGVAMRAAANEPGTGDPATDDFAQIRPWVKEIVKANPNIDPMHIPVIMNSFKPYFTADQRAKADELKQQEKLNKDAETERHHNVQEEQAGRRISIARDRATSYIESNQEKMSQATEKLAAARTKQEFDEAYRSAELTIRGIVDGARGQGSTMSAEERAAYEAGINSAVGGFRTTLAGIKRGDLTPQPQGGQSQTGQPAQPGAAAPPADHSADLDNARQAIAAGADRDAVVKRLQDAGIDASGL